ncbi:MAG: AAA family ATPase [Actinobacteria bacterium]|nr:AAA family ATPase [Actinomycetota bacterium]
MLVEREDQLAVLAAQLDQAVAGHGRLIFLGGEAGVGKTSVVSALAERALAVVSEPVGVRRGVVDNLSPPTALAGLIEALPELSGLVETSGTIDGRALFAAIRATLGATATLLVLEDVHWADEATLDVLRYLGRRLDGLPLLVIATFRIEEVSARHRLSTVMGDLATAPGVSRLLVEPLSVAGVADLIAGAGSTIDAATLHARTSGNAFYVSEVLAGAGDDLPATVRDAVLARVSRLSEPAQIVLGAAAVLGAPADTTLLAAVAAQDAGAVDECVDNGLLIRQRAGWIFRHDLARVSVEQTIGASELVGLNRRALAELSARGEDDDGRLARHAAAADDHSAVLRHAIPAAVRAARLGAHRESADLYRLALRANITDASARERMLVALSYECYLTDDVEDALAARLRAMELASLTGSTLALGRHLRWVSRLSWFLGRNVDADRYARRAVNSLEVEPRDEHELAMAYSNMAQLSMLGGDVDAAQDWGARALSIAERTGDREVQIHALNNIGSALVQRDGSDEGWEQLRQSLDFALTDDEHEHAARAYTNLGSLAVSARRLRAGEDDLRAGIAYCADRDLDSWRLYMLAHQARLFAEQGRYSQADAAASEVLSHPRPSPITEIVAGTVRAVLAIRRGEDARVLLERAWELAERTGELQRLALVAAARAEAAWVSGELLGASAVHRALDLAWSAPGARTAMWETAEIAYWRAQALLPIDSPGRLPAPFSLMIAGRWAEAARDWAEIGAPLWQAHALARLPSLEAGREALGIVEELGLPAYHHAILRMRQSLGLSLPRGPRASHRENPAALTDRELEVLGLLGLGLSNAEIARRLFLSEKTVGHHVSAVLRKVGEPTRARAVAWALQAGVLTPTAGAAGAPT